jgi:hypothetical protein
MKQQLGFQKFRNALRCLAARILAIGFSIAIGVLPALSGLSYKRSSALVYDAAVLIKPSDFDAGLLRETFDRFASQECGTRKLARMIVATSERDLGDAINAILPGAVSESQIHSAQSRNLKVAQVLCFEGRITSFVRDGRAIRRDALRGSADSRNVTVEGMPLTIIGFRLRAESLQAAPSVPNALPDRVWLYARAKVLPSAQLAAQIHASLQRRVGVQLYLIVRTDPYFFDFDGPICDLFETSAGESYTKALLAQPSMVCTPVGDQARCGLFNGRK